MKRLRRAFQVKFSFMSLILFSSFCNKLVESIIIKYAAYLLHNEELHSLYRSPNVVRINLPLFSTVVPSNICVFLSCRPFVVITTLSTGLVGVEVTSVSWLGQLEVGV